MALLLFVAFPFDHTSWRVNPMRVIVTLSIPFKLK